MPNGFFYVHFLDTFISIRRDVWLVFIITMVYSNSCTVMLCTLNKYTNLLCDVIQSRKVCYTVVSCAAKIVFLIHTITNCGTFRVILFLIFLFYHWSPASHSCMKKGLHMK